MSVENFQVERVGTKVKIWFNSGADVENCMVAFYREFETEIEADLVMQNVIEIIDERDCDMRNHGYEYALKASTKRICDDAVPLITEGRAF